MKDVNALIEQANNLFARVDAHASELVALKEGLNGENLEAARSVLANSMDVARAFMAEYNEMAVEQGERLKNAMERALAGAVVEVEEAEGLKNFHTSLGSVLDAMTNFNDAQTSIIDALMTAQ